MIHTESDHESDDATDEDAQSQGDGDVHTELGHSVLRHLPRSQVPHVAHHQGTSVGAGLGLLVHHFRCLHWDEGLLAAIRGRG